ncbi:MAG: hypothetical protein LLF94_02925 [Chlamydiales bacterium]|nr:hypothetical protein [Chlamydiales bacterium]
MNDLNNLLAATHIAPPTVNATSWVKSLDLVYGTKNPVLKPHKQIAIDGDAIHEILRGRENQERESRDHDGSVPNYVVASISFVVSDRPHVKGGAHGRKVITIPIKYNGQEISHVTSVYTFDQKVTTPQKKDPTKSKTYKRSSDFRADLLDDSTEESKSRVETYYAKGTNSFSDSYHHSERALWGALKKAETIQLLINQLFAKLGYAPKVYAAVLDLHSTRYMCAECEPSSFCFQKKRGKFLTRMEEALKRSCILSEKSGLTFCTRVSAEDNSKRSLKQNSDHSEFWADRNVKRLRNGALNLILQRDDRTTNPGANIYGTFVSSERLNAPQAVFLTKRRANASVALGITASNRSFIKHVAENNRVVTEILSEMAAHRQAGRNKQERIAMAQRAYALCPDDIQVLAGCRNAYYENDMFIEALGYCRSVSRRLISTRNSYLVAWADYVNTNAIQVLNLLVDGASEVIDQVCSLDWLHTLDDLDSPLLFCVRAALLLELKRFKESHDDFHKALALLKTDPYLNLDKKKEYESYIQSSLEVIEHAA